MRHIPAAAKRKQHLKQIGPKIEKDRPQRSDMRRHIDGPPLIGLVRHHGNQRQMAGGGDWQKLGQSLHGGNEDDQIQRHGGDLDVGPKAGQTLPCNPYPVKTAISATYRSISELKKEK